MHLNLDAYKLYSCMHHDHILLSCRMLTSLILTENRFGEKGASALISSLQHNSSLTTLSLEVASTGSPKAVLDSLLAKNKELMECKKMIRELKQKNEALEREVAECRAELKLARQTANKEML